MSIASNYDKVLRIPWFVVDYSYFTGVCSISMMLFIFMDEIYFGMCLMIFYLYFPPFYMNSCKNKSIFNDKCCQYRGTSECKTSILTWEFCTSSTGFVATKGTGTEASCNYPDIWLSCWVNEALYVALGYTEIYLCISHSMVVPCSRCSPTMV